jgi:hypothetical protein
MLTKSVKSDLVTKIQALQEVSTKDFADSAVGKAFSGLLPEIRKTLADQEANAREQFEKANGAPDKELQFRFAAVEILSEVFRGQDAKDFAEGFNLLKSLVQARLGLVHYSEKEFYSALIKALRGEAGGISKELAAKFETFLKDYSKEDRNFSALVKSNSLTNSLGNLLICEGKVQNLAVGATKGEVEVSTLTIRQAVEAISKGRTPYKVAAKK